MNPYFQNQQFGYQNMPGYYGYNQGSYNGYAYASPTQTIQAMYTTVHPYDSKEFLLATFGNKPQYIKFFLTLSHQDKLKMYMLMEQKRLYGEMTDKQSYQKILKQIAQKIQNFNLFHQAEAQKLPSQDKSKQLENKIDFIVQKTFQKLNLAQAQSKGSSTPKKQAQILDQDEWVESTETKQPQRQNPINPTPQRQYPQNQFGNQSKNKEIQSKSQVFNMFTFDSKMYEAMTHEIGLKTVNELQKKSIWELQVEQSQIRDEAPNLKEIFNIKQTAQQKIQAINLNKNMSTHNQNTVLSSMNSPRQFKPQSGAISMNSSSLLDLYKINSSGNQTHQQKESNQQVQPKLQESIQDFDSFVESNPQEPDNHSQVEPNSMLFQNVLPSYQNANFYKEQSNLKNTQDLQLNSFQERSQPNTNQTEELHLNNQNVAKEQGKLVQQIQIKTQVTTVQSTIENPAKVIDYENLLFDSVQIQTPSLTSNFDFLQAFTTNKIQTNPQTSKIPEGLLTNNQQLDGEVLFQSQVMVTQSTIPKVQQLSLSTSEPTTEIPPLDLIRSSLSSRNLENQELLKKLKVQFSQSDRLTIQKGLKNKSFQCNTQFYLTVINFLRLASLEWSPQYRHFTEQFKIVKQLRQQSQRYSKAVDQDEQQNVTASIKITKGLLNNIYQNSSKTEKYVLNFLDQKSEEKGFLYKFGRILLSSSPNTQIFQKVINQDNKQILKSFYVLYLIQKLSSTAKLKLFSQKLMIYLGQQYQKYKQLQVQKLNEVQNEEQSYPKYIVYIKGLVKLCAICERMITLLKLCCIKTHSNTVKMVKMCKDIRVKYSKYDEIDNNAKNHHQTLQQSIKTNIERNKSVYDLHNSFFDSYNRQPLCALCLKLIKKDGSKIDQIYYHYSCFNLSMRIQKQIEYFTQ